MDNISNLELSVVLAVLLVTSGVFSLAETAMMAVNRFRLKHRAQRGARGARLAIALLGETDRLLGVILLGNNLINAAAATLATVITVRLFGEGELALALGTVAVTFGILVISEITPKVIGAAHADRIVPIVSFVLRPMLKAAAPVVWFVNLFVQGLLRLLRIRPVAEAGSTLTQEELRSLVLEGQYFRGKHRAMLANLLDLEAITVDDVMTPRNQIHAIDIGDKPAHLVNQLATSYHTRLPVYEGQLDNIVGTLHLKQVLHLQNSAGIDRESLQGALRPPYFVPSGTPLLTQLQQFQTARERLGLVVDEYGELQGLVTIEDIVEEIIGEFTTEAPGAGGSSFAREPDGSVVVDGMAQLRALNRKLGTHFPVDGPRTLNGLIVEHLGEIPDAGSRVELAGQAIEVLQTQDRAIKVMRLRAPVGRAAAAPLQSPNGQASSSG
jgi:Mg2+/Co2+ transporter CorB